MPHLRSLVQRHKDDPFTVLGINYNDPVAKFNAGVEKHEVTWPTIYQDSAPFLTQLFKVQGYPTYILVDGEGKSAHVAHPGEEAASDALIASLIKDATMRAEKEMMDKKKMDEEKANGGAGE